MRQSPKLAEYKVVVVMKLSILNLCIFLGSLTISYCLRYTPKEAVLTIKSIVEFAETEDRKTVPEITNSVYEVLKVANNSENEDSVGLEKAQEEAITKLFYMTEAAKINSIEELKAVLNETDNMKANMVQSNVILISKGIKPKDLIEAKNGFSNEVNTPHNNNSKEPELKIYPKADSEDPDYTVTEKKLRSAIHIPKGFEYGEGDKQPFIFIPATGVRGGMNFYYNLMKTLNQTGLIDPVWINNPDDMLADIQITSQYIAYAINYIADISGKNVSIASWSQGNLASQWQFTFWSSSRSKVSDFIAISPDFHGTTGNVGCPAPNTTGCPPAALQKQFDTNFMDALWSHGGGSSHVPTTILYSMHDQTVKPKSGKNSSFILDNENKAGVKVNEVTKLCPGKNASDRYFHESMLFNPLVHALAVDAIKNGGPGDPSRIDLDSVCKTNYPESLTLEDVICSEAVNVQSGIHTLSHFKTTEEPAVRKYAKGD